VDPILVATHHGGDWRRTTTKETWGPTGYLGRYHRAVSWILTSGTSLVWTGLTCYRPPWSLQRRAFVFPSPSIYAMCAQTVCHQGLS
jgi:hypothetical protein